MLRALPSGVLPLVFPSAFLRSFREAAPSRLRHFEARSCIFGASSTEAPRGISPDLAMCARLQVGRRPLATSPRARSVVRGRARQAAQQQQALQAQQQQQLQQQALRGRASWLRAPLSPLRGFDR